MPRRCNHKNVVKVLGMAPIPGPAGGVYIAMPLREAGSLRDALSGHAAGKLLWYMRCGRITDRAPTPALAAN